MRLRRSTVPALAGALAVVVGAGSAHAQTPGMLNPGPVVGTARPAAPPAPPPPGLPGAVGNTTGAPAPPAAAESGLSPTAELFDAINRGDLAAARDAIGRGAQLDAKNLLGMTPLELAVDLNRNDIAFLLLSIEHEGRAAASSVGAAPALSVPPAPAAVPSSSVAARGAAGASAAGESVASLLLASPPGPSAPIARPAPARDADPAASLQSVGGGSPNPAVGFLGFGPTGGAAVQN